MLRNFFTIVVALTIDAFQILLPMGIIAIFTTAGGTLAGAAAGGVIAGSVGAAVLGFVGSFLNVAAAPAGFVLGTGLAAIIDFCISAVFGTGFIILLVMTGLLPLKQILSLRRTPLVVGKLVPFFGMLPFYTALTVLCIVEQSGNAQKMAGEAVSLAMMGGRGIRSGEKALQESAGGTPGNSFPVSTQQFDYKEEGGAKNPRRSASLPLMNDIRPADKPFPTTRGMLEDGERQRNPAL